MSEQNNNFNQDFNLDFLNEPVPAEVAPAKKKSKVPVGVIVGLSIMALCIIAVVAIVLGGALDGFGGGGGGQGDAVDAERNEFIEGLGGVSETFDGIVSRDNYPNSTMAAEAFVTEELKGETGKAILHSVESKGELSDSEIRATKIPDRLLEGADAVEEYEIEYEIGEAAAYTRSGADGVGSTQTKRVKVYVIKYGTNWKYFAPLPETGDTISKSYYDSVFNGDKYKNCTFETTTTATVKADGAGEHIDMTVEMYQLIKHAENKVYFEQRTVMPSNGESQEMTICAYLEDNYGRIKCYVKKEVGGETIDDWTEGELSTIGFTSLEELTPFYDQYLDYTYFTKAEYGFKLADENARKYFKDALMGALGELTIFIDLDTMNLDMYAEYYVQDGTLTGMRTDADVSLIVEEYGESVTLEEGVTSIVKCYDYGTTVIESPVK